MSKIAVYFEPDQNNQFYSFTSRNQPALLIIFGLAAIIVLLFYSWK